jgi:uncharacterized protein
MTAPDIQVQVVFAPLQGTLDSTAVRLPEGSTLMDAVRVSGLLQRHPQLADLPTGIWGRKQPPETPLREGDRVEVYRALLCDPKEARRLRYRQRADKAARSLPAAAAAPASDDGAA